jgi:hypothetical protein
MQSILEFLLTEVVVQPRAANASFDHFVGADADKYSRTFASS